MAKCTTDAMKDTIYEGRGLFFHDALSQLTERDTITWMKNNKYGDRTYYSMWIKPELGCNDVVEREDGKPVRSYSKRPVGNSPELMCLDNSLNQDIHENVRRNVSATSFLPDDDERKFSLTTPSHIVRAYRRVHCPTTSHSTIPSSNRIIQDIRKVLFALRCIVEVEGNVVRGLASREGHRRWVDSRALELPEGYGGDDGDDGGDGGDGDKGFQIGRAHV